MANGGTILMRKPEWLKARLPAGAAYFALKSKLRQRELHTICESAHCPNAHECWNDNQATFLIMGAVCSRNCRFCAVNAGSPGPLDNDEGRKLSEMAELMGLRYVVITSVTRDDLPDKGSGHFAMVLRTVKRGRPDWESRPWSPISPVVLSCWMPFSMPEWMSWLTTLKRCPRCMPRSTAVPPLFSIHCRYCSTARSAAGSPRAA